jgi:hypothetical protein
VRDRGQILATILLSLVVVGVLSISHAQARFDAPLSSSAQHEHGPATISTSTNAHADVEHLRYDWTPALHSAAAAPAQSMALPLFAAAGPPLAPTATTPTYLRLCVLLL